MSSYKYFFCTWIIFLFKGIHHQQTILRLFHTCITPMYNYIFRLKLNSYFQISQKYMAFLIKSKYRVKFLNCFSRVARKFGEFRSSQKHYYYSRPIKVWLARSVTDIPHLRLACLIGDPLKTSTCFIGDQHAWSETHLRPTYPIGNWHSPSEIHLKPTCLIGDQQTCLIEDKLETDMPD